MPKILVADDSPTIQKVIAITLADEPYELEQSHNVDDLKSKLAKNRYDLILLDFNLSDSLTGLDLARSLRQSSDAPIMALVGTFDTINQNDLKNAGLNDFIAKPFESDKFIAKCRALLAEESFEEEPERTSEFQLEEFASLETEEDAEELSLDQGGMDEWKLNDSSFAKTEVISEEHGADAGFDLEAEDSPAMSTNSLYKALEGWGMSVPEVITSKPANKEITPELSLGSSEEDMSLPSDNDLEYPDFGSKPESALSPKSKLISLDELAPTEEEDDHDSTDPTYEMPSLDKATPFELEKEIEAEISPEEFWAVDETEKPKEKKPIAKPEVHASVKIEENYIRPKEPELVLETRKGSSKREVATPSTSSTQSAQAPSIDYDILFEKIKPYIDTKIKEYITATINQVAWEVIPELSENIIRKEMNAIAEKVISQERQ
jgi:DNA-binding response OmpR family regulator